jgi:PAS domain S-box-containing protein
MGYSNFDAQIDRLQEQLIELQRQGSGTEVLSEGFERISVGLEALRISAEEERKHLLAQIKHAQNRADETARNLEAKVSGLLEGSRAVLQQSEFETTARSIFDACKRLTGATSGYVALLTEDGTENEVLFIDSGGAVCKVDPTLPMPVRGLREEAYRTGRTVYDNHFPQSEWIQLLPPGHASLDNVLFAPLVIKGITVGLLGLANKPGAFDENDVRLASAFGELAATALFNSRTLESLQDREEILRHQAHELGERVKELNCLYGISGLFEKPGISLDEILKETVDLVAAAWQYPKITGARITLEGQDFRTENFREDAPWQQIADIIVNGQPGGAVQVCYLEERPERDEGPFLKEERFLIKAIAEQLGRITERMRVESQRNAALNKLQESEARWRSLTEHSPDHILTLDTNLNIQFANYASPGLTMEELIGTPLYRYVEEERQAEIKGILENVLKTREPTNYETEYVAPDGRIIYYESRLVPRITLDKVAGLTVSARDITEHKRAQEQIQRLAKFPGENQNPVLRISQDGTIRYANRASAPLLTLWASEVGQKLPEDLRQLTSRVIGSGEGHTIQVDCDGRVFSIHFVPVPKVDYVNLYGHDITELMKAEALLKEQNQFITTVFESLAHPFYVINANDYTIRMANSAARSGALPEAVTCYALTHRRSTPCGDAEHVCPLEEIKKTRAPVIIEHAHYDEEGNRKVFEVHGHPIFDGEGRVAQVIEYTLEVTERRQAEQELIERTHELSTLLQISRQVALTLELEPLLGLILDHLKTVVDYEGATISRWEGETLSVLAHRGVIPQEHASQLRFDPEDTLIGRQVILDQKPVIIPDVAADTPVAHDLRKLVGQRLETTSPQAGSWMALPLTVKDRVIGILTLQHSQSDYFKRRQADLAFAFASQAAVAVENSQLYEQAQALAAVEERQRLARELHDVVSQTLFSASLSADVLPRLWERNPEEGQRCLNEVRQLTRGALAEMRTLLLELRPAALAEGKLGDLLRHLAEAITSQARLPVTLEVEGECDLSPEVKVAVYRIAQEALNNVARHAAASQATVHLRCVPSAPPGNGEPSEGLELRISDDGHGFDLAGVAPDSLGLGIMTERAQAIEADLKIESQIGHGTQVIIVWPKHQN